MTKIICDLCADTILTPIRVRVHDGESPHNGSTIYKTIDVCNGCIKKFRDLESCAEYSDLVVKEIA